MMCGAPDLVRRNFMASRVLRISGSLLNAGVIFGHARLFTMWCWYPWALAYAACVCKNGAACSRMLGVAMVRMCLDMN